MFSKFDNTNLYTCETCGKSFKNKNSLNTHKATHIEVPSPCDICNKVFKSTKVLKHHKNTVHTDNTFNCNKCPKSFLLLQI